MKSYKHFTIIEREILLILHELGLSTRKIATCIRKHYSSVARELKRNSKNNKKYDPKKAQKYIKLFDEKKKIEFKLFKEIMAVLSDRNTKTFFEKELELNNIKHKLIKPRIPKQNGKVERSHRKDQENLYYEQKFLNFEDFKRKLSRWIREYNNTGMKPLNWKSPNQILEEYKKLTAEK